uniref:Uncharacterized protein n=1 Tax=Zea mays TaxID=4577 RepID=B7ZY30_MAIZE|nr:unknown [Zea mays]
MSTNEQHASPNRLHLLWPEISAFHTTGVSRSRSLNSARAAAPSPPAAYAVTREVATWALRPIPNLTTCAWTARTGAAEEPRATALSRGGNV